MLFFFIVGGIFIFAIVVIGFLFYLLKKESDQPSSLNTLKDALKVTSSSSDPKVNPFLEVPSSPIALNPLELPEVMQLTREYAEKESVYENKVQKLENELKDISQTAQHQSKEALDTIERLRRENEELKAQKMLAEPSNESVQRAQETAQNLHQDQTALQSRLSESQEQAQKLQDEILSIKSQMSLEINQVKAEAEQLFIDNERLKNSLQDVVLEATKTLQDDISLLKKENEALKAANEEAALLNRSLHSSSEAASPDAINSLQDEVDALKQQIQALKSTNNDLLLANQGLKISAESTVADALSTLQEELDLMRKENNELKSVNEELMAKSSGEASRVEVPVAAVGDSSNLQSQLDALTRENQALKNVANDLSLANQRVKELAEQNEHLAERTEALQWDLNKARAQTTSFERACENYQLQLKEALDQKGSKNE